MSNRPNPHQNAPSRAVAKARGSSDRTGLLALLALIPIYLWVVGVVLVAGVAVVVLASSGGGNSAVADQVQPVTVTGEHLPALPEGGDDPAVGQTAPTLEGHNFTGEPVTIGGESDQPSIVVFVAHWCPHCQSEVPRLVEWRADGTIPDDITLAAVATSTQEVQPNYPPQAWLEREQWPGTVLADSEGSDAAEAYGVTAFPFFVALNADGTVAARGSGELDQQGIDDLVASLEQPS